MNHSVISGTATSVGTNIAAREWLDETRATFGSTHNRSLVFYFHTHPGTQGMLIANGGGARYGNLDRGSDADMRNLRNFNRDVGGAYEFAVLVTETNIIAYTETNSQLCTFKR